MEQEEELLEVGNAGGFESIKNESVYCSKCSVLDKRCRKAEERCSFLESEIDKKMNDIEELRRQIVESQVQNDSLKSLPKTIKGFDEQSTQTLTGDNATAAEKGEGGGEKCVIDLMNDVENDIVLELMIENKVLNCEKNKAESDVVFWKTKCEELELQVTLLEKNLSTTTGTNNVGFALSDRSKKPVIKTEIIKEDCCDVATPMIHSFHGNSRQVIGASEEIFHDKRLEYNFRTRKRLNFGDETCDKITPATPAGGLPAVCGLIDISDSSDDDQHAPQKSKDMTHGLADLEGGIVSSDKKKLSSRTRSMKVKVESESGDDDMTHCYQGTPSLLASKRKRAYHIVQSDSGSDTNDNVPLHRLRKRYSTVENKHNRVIPTTGSCTDDETEDNESDCEGESLNGFIVSGSELNSSVDGESSQCNEKSSCESEDKSEDKVDYGEIMNIIGRKKKDDLSKWEFEADMLAAFGKDPELCMKGVCALYRQQTSDEKSCKATIYQNQRGFSQFDGTRGSILGEFLTDGDPEGGLKKCVEELLEFQPKGVELCTTLATRYSEQLFAMYQNQEDPLWPALDTLSY